MMPPTPSSARRSLAARLTLTILVGVLIASVPSHPSGQAARTGWTVVAWNNLGMHCMDADFGVFSILPPYNTIQAQVIDPEGRLVTSPAGITLVYQGVADPTGSINTTSAGKTNFWSFVKALFGTALAVDIGLLNHNMPGLANAQQLMVFDPALNWYIAEGIPITPFDDAGEKNFYPLMKVSAKDASGATLASTNIVLPVSDEMDCSSCHASGSVEAARPSAGWVSLLPADPQRDFRLNILRRHDDGKVGTATYSAALSARGYLASGLYATATAAPAAGGKPVLCAHCHKSEALAGSGFAGIRPLTAAIHTLHGTAVDPTNGLTLDATDNRSACYRCHPGSETRCLRGVMGNAVAADGSMAIQCQHCHGRMSDVGAPTRTGWLNEPTCQQCHSGTAAHNSGAIRYTSAFDASGQPRVSADPTFATSDDAPAPGLSLYRFSAGHGGLQCSACHGSTHAEYPSSHPNDNLQSVALQGHVGTIAECSTCHTQVPSTNTGGPHGLHPVGSSWVSSHGGAAESNRTQCQACHGLDYRGTVLSRSFAARTLTTKFGTKPLFRGAQVSCYMCHNGPSSESATSNRPPVATNLFASTAAGAPVAIHLLATDPDGNALTLRIVSQPVNGTVSLSGATATYFPFAGFVGTETFTYAAWDGSIDSNLATVTTVVNATACTLTSTASVPATITVGSAAVFTASATPSGCAGPVTYDWAFGDGTAHAVSQNATHTYASAGTFTWTMTASANGVTSVRNGSIVASAVVAPALSISRVRALSDPFAIEITGANFQTGAAVFIGSDGQPWPGTRRDSSTRLVLTGTNLAARFPSRTSVTIRVVNPDGKSATSSFTFRR
jgi:PKD repeat protein